VACGRSLSLRVGFGRHRIAVSAIDAAGNRDPKAANYRWAVRKRRR
jgi:hypothetical protein